MLLGTLKSLFQITTLYRKYNASSTNDVLYNHSLAHKITNNLSIPSKLSIFFYKIRVLARVGSTTLIFVSFFSCACRYRWRKFSLLLLCPLPPILRSYHSSGHNKHAPLICVVGCSQKFQFITSVSSNYSWVRLQRVTA